ncbi:MAG: Three-Cys-motif partner protein [Rubritepida sp.]|nr:Three-Cys-motif partner protein [Rubritepida sp.]
MDVYLQREQTKAKHFILRRYLQALAFKVLRSWDVTYIDGFSGPWQSRTSDFSDTSFMIAIDVLKDAQKRILQDTGNLRHIRCFFSESDAVAYKKLENAVAPHRSVSGKFEIQTYFGKFEDAVEQIKNIINGNFPLIFIDPTGWTGYPFHKIKSIFDSDKCEVLINFMYDFVNRFVSSQDVNTIASLDPILGGAGWHQRLDQSLPRGAAVEKLFRETLKREGRFQYVISTKIDKNTIDRPHFFLAYGTKSREGLKAFRRIEHEALKEHARNRVSAKERRREDLTGVDELFPGYDAQQEATIDDVVIQQKKIAAADIRVFLAERGGVRFSTIVDFALQAHMLRETNIKDICLQLARDGFIQNTWGNGNRKPSDDTIIQPR